MRRALAKAEREIERLELEVTLAEMQAVEERAAAEAEVASGERALAIAEAELDRYLRARLPLQQAEAEMAIERAAQDLRAAQADLEGIRRIYEEEPEARSKEEIIHRHEVAVVFAKWRREVAEMKLEHLTAFDMPLERQRLDSGIAKARAALAKARAGAERKHLAGLLAIARKGDALEDGRHKLEDLQKELRKLEQQAEKRRKLKQQKAGKEKAGKQESEKAPGQAEDGGV